MAVREKKILGTVGYMGGVPAVLEPFCWSWGQFIAYNTENLCNKENIIYYTKSRHSLHSEARNYMVKEMRGDWLLQLDTDHQFEPDLLERMLKVMENFEPHVKVLSGLYGSRVNKTPMIYRYDTEINGFHHITMWPEGIPIIPVDSAGGGCLLVKREVFEKIQEELGERPFDIIPPFSEDHSFFLRLMKLKIPAYCCSYIEDKHLQFSTVNIEKSLIPIYPSNIQERNI